VRCLFFAEQTSVGEKFGVVELFAFDLSLTPEQHPYTFSCSTFPNPSPPPPPPSLATLNSSSLAHLQFFFFFFPFSPSAVAKRQWCYHSTP